MTSDLAVTVYGGAAGDRDTGEIGGNRILLEWDEHRWFLDFGLRFKSHGRFYEEFLKPRGSSCGLRDYLRMGLLPPVEGLYRDDLWCHEPDLWDRYRGAHPQHRRLDGVDGVCVSHAHLDHNGCLGFLRSDVPVYTGLTTAVIAKAMQDIKGSGPENEFAYLAPREANDDGVLQGVRGERVQRRHVVCEDIELTAELQGFWCTVPGTRTNLKACPLELWRDREGMRFWRMDHSIPGSGAFGVETSAGWVIYSGDVRRHGHSSKRVDTFVEEAKALGPALLVVEGTRVSETSSVREEDVRAAASDVVGRAEGLVVADFGPRNIERLRVFHEVALEQGRQLVVTVEDAYMLQQLHRVDPAIPDVSLDSVTILKEPLGSDRVWMRRVYEDYPGDVVRAADVRRDADGYILCLSFWDISNLVDLEPDGGTYVYSSSEAYSEEQEIDQRRLRNWLAHFGMAVYGGIPGAETFDLPLHASGHADGPAMEAMIDELGAEKIMPVHTEDLEWFEQRWPDKLVVAADGIPRAID